MLVKLYLFLLISSVSYLMTDLIEMTGCTIFCYVLVIKEEEKKDLPLLCCFLYVYALNHCDFVQFYIVACDINVLWYKLQSIKVRLDRLTVLFRKVCLKLYCMNQPYCTEVMQFLFHRMPVDFKWIRWFRLDMISFEKKIKNKKHFGTSLKH